MLTFAFVIYEFIKTFLNMTMIESIIARAKSNRQRIVLPESLEERTLTAADKSLADGIADIILIGNPDEIFALAQKLGLKNIDKATIIDPATSEKTAEYANLLYELRKNKGMTPEQAAKLVLDPLYFGCLIIKSGDADGQISELFPQQARRFVLPFRSSNVLPESLA